MASLIRKGQAPSSVAEARRLEPAVLLRAAQRGDRPAQAVLFERHHERVARLVLRMTGDEMAVDDLVQDVFIAAYAALPRFRGESRVESWLYKIAVNKSRSWWTREQRRRRRELNAPLFQSRGDESLDDELIRARHHARLYAALGQLPHTYREAFVARAIDGLTLRQASEMLGVGIRTLSFRALRAQDMLCEALGIPRAP